MRASLWLGPVLLAGACITTSPTTNSEVITDLTITPADGYAAIADGASRATVRITTVDDDGRDPALMATLKLTAGAWLAPDASDPKTVTVALNSRTASRDLVVPRQPGALTVTAAVAGFTRDASLTLSAAPVTRLDCGVTGALPSSTAASTLTLSATLETQLGGSRPSLGTAVDFSIDVAPGGGAYPAAQRVFVTDASTVQATFTALPGLTSLDATAAVGSQTCSVAVGH